MPLLQRVAHRVSELLGPDSIPIRLLRPSYERLLNLWTRGRGYKCTLNGMEQFYLDPRLRGIFPTVYDPLVMDYLRAHVESGQVSLNVGANLGIYSLCLAYWSRPRGLVFAFEPNPAVRLLLQDLTNRNSFQARLLVQSEAVGGTLGTEILYAVDGAFHGCSRLGQPNPEKMAETHQPITVTVTTLDAFCQKHAIRPDWLVIDIEGYEVEALGGARATIHANRGRLGLFVEMHPKLWELSGTSRQELEALLLELGLRPVGLAGQSDPLGKNGMVRLDYV